MEVFRNAKTVRLKSHHDKFLVADEDEEHVSQGRSGASRSARWSVELSDASDAVIRLKSCYGRYLTASNEPMLLGMTGRKVLQTLPPRLDSSVEWEPVRDGFQVRLKTRYGQYLRANGGPPPWRNSVTHDIPHRTSTQDWVLWDVEIVEVRTKEEGEFVKEQKTAPAAAAVAEAEGRWELSSPESTPSRSPRVSRADLSQSSSSFSGSPRRSDGRSIHCTIAEDDGSTDGSPELCFSFKGTTVRELTEKLEEALEIDDDIFVCTRNPLNGLLCPLHLQLPPNKMTMHVVVVRASSRVAKNFKKVESTK